MEYRKLISFGKSSFVISIPKSWIGKSKLKKGDLIYLEEKDADLILSPHSQNTEQKEKEMTIEVDGKELKHIKREIIGAYIKNYKTIILTGNEIKDKAKEIQSVIQRLVALEVMEQTSKRMVAKDFLNLDDVSTKSILRKLDVIIRSMFEDCEKSFEEDNYESINYRDLDVNKLVFLMFRIVRFGQENTSYAFKKFDLSPVELSNLWWLSYDLESIADEIKRIARYLRQVSLDKHKQKEFMELLREIKESYLNIMKAYYEKDVPLVHKVINQREEIISHCESFGGKDKQGGKIVGLLAERAKIAIVHINHIGRVLYQS